MGKVKKRCDEITACESDNGEESYGSDDEKVYGMDGEDSGEEEEGIALKMKRRPGEPTNAERRAHRLTHIPYRIWRGSAWQGRAKTTDTKRSWKSKTRAACQKYMSIIVFCGMQKPRRVERS